jgi:hypothetical protein
MVRCERCATEFETRPSEAKGRRACSRACYLRLAFLDGQGHVNEGGYRVAFTGRDGKPVLEHRIVMEGVVGRELLPHENVHHRNGQRADNRPENLELWSSWQPSGQSVADKVAWAKELLGVYEPGALR